MKFSRNWLREFVDVPASADALADVLTMGGVEIEAIENRGADFDNVVVAQITASRPHPNADRLSVCEVNDGSGSTRQIVCGATNYKTGDKVPLAQPGAKLPNGLEIRKSKLRGVESEGMLCSATELGLGQDASGLLILSPEAEVGARLMKLFPPDAIFDVEITPNRGDLLSHFGLAREIAALMSSRAKSRDPREVDLKVPRRDPSASLRSARDDVRISAPRECPLYSARRIENVRVGPSPGWLRARIESVGVRSINNIVDISNFVMLELGQPTHAFDAEKLRGGIDVRLAGEAEKLLALDGRTYSLARSELVIADADGPVAIAGVMGGEGTAVSETTRTVLLESAYFLPASVRRTARRLNLPSDASYRFERGVDPEMVLPGSQRATELICELAGGKAAEEISIAGELPANPGNITLNYVSLDRLLGIDVPSETADEILTRFGLEKVGQVSYAPECNTWKIPSYRGDLQREVDLIEEVVRAFGIANVPRADRSRFTPASTADRRYDFETELRRRITALGLYEARTSALIPRREAEKESAATRLRNPLSEDHVALRTSLIPGLLEALARNARAGAERIAIFEIGNVFLASGNEQARCIAFALNGRVHSLRSWRAETERPFDFFDLKGLIEALVATRGHERAVCYRRIERSPFALAAEVLDGEEDLGICAQLGTAEAKALDASGTVLVAELRLEELARIAQPGAKFHEIERYPAVRRDIAMFVSPEITHEAIGDAIASAQEPLLEKVELFDLFAEASAQSGETARKSLAYSLTYRDKNRTLTNEEVNAAHARIRERLRRQVGAQLRE